ncbi:MAG: hypothetical protein HN778_13965 [Prolixibacteraceae bacterium]|jgi:hypothetical protein|nr:hypothetical protein [Prolixibacteraceae bacterium]MBT6006961.1 hypothetical protein [Prolixibacteraceae bacterium]MBT6766782.1 hypothetical protein [Prolixibacteraceae bacterium]MBT7000489.1 hypothetical protein [Prolixibacteraceae bacterium]MBT7395933.1 hypothetical protein [Prolixibacteraceae bacterium]
MKFTNKTQLYIFVALVLTITFITVLFHYSIHITDALTLETLTDYGIQISIWRIVFEPFIGVLLFFNRSFFAIEELKFLLYWLLAIFTIYSIIKSILIKEKQLIKKFIFRQLVNLPIIGGLWFAAFVLILFIPLPNNTIVNNSKNSVLVNTHSHNDFSHDGVISQDGLWKWHKRNGFDAFYITDHNNHDKTFEFVQAQRNYEFPNEPLVMCGEEFSGSNHLSLLGLKAKFSTQGFTDSTAINLTHSGRGVVIVNHWFDGEKMSLEYYKNLGVDGFEIENTATNFTYDRKLYKKIKNYCQENNLIMLGGVDFHGYGNACSLWNAFDIPGWQSLDPVAKENAILKIIKTRDQDKLQVLLYNDRPYYTEKNLLFSPVFTLFNYFRTLDFYQIISWIFWILFFAIIKNTISSNNKLQKQFSTHRLVSVFGVLGAFFLLGLSLVYQLRIENIIGFTEMYEEYSALLFYTGLVFLVYSGVVTSFKIFIRKA